MGSPTMRQRTLALRLQKLREAAKMSMDDVPWSTGKLSRIENRKIKISESDVKFLCRLYGVKDPKTINELVDLARHALDRGWWQSYGSAIHRETQTLIGLEGEASELRTFETQIPGLLQTEAYAESMIRAFRPDAPANKIEQWVRVRMMRQDILRRTKAPLVHVVLDEGAVRRLVGGREVMRQQLTALATCDNPRVTVQVLPHVAGEHRATAGPFVILDFADGDLGLVYVEQITSALVMETREELDKYRETFDHVVHLALTPSESRDMMLQLAKQL